LSYWEAEIKLQFLKTTSDFRASQNFAHNNKEVVQLLTPKERCNKYKKNKKLLRGGLPQYKGDSPRNPKRRRGK